jgi:hypothetical protein
LASKPLPQCTANVADGSQPDSCSATNRTKERFAKCSAFDVTRQFLVDHIQRIIYMRSKVTIFGSVPVKRGPFQAAVPVPFRIEGDLDRKAIRAKPRKLLPDDGRWKKLKQSNSDDVRAVVKEVALIYPDERTRLA